MHSLIARALDAATLRERLLFATLLAATLSACGAGDAADPAGVVEHHLSRFDTLVTTESGLIGVAADLAVAPDGRVWIADRVLHRVLVVDPEDGTALPIGREGAGPGEFRSPEAVAASDSAVFVLDFGNRRIQCLRADGAPVGTTRIATVVYLPADLDARGALVTPTLGMDSSLATVLAPAGSGPERLGLGEPLADPPRMISRREIRDQALRGEIPREFRNNVLPVLGPDGVTWLVLQGEGILQRYDPDGRLLYSTPIADPEIAAARDAFFAAWTSGDGPDGIPVPWSAVAGVAVEGELWLRIGPGADGRSVIAVLDGDTGEVLRRYVLGLATPAGPFAVDGRRRRLYVALPDEGALVGAALP